METDDNSTSLRVESFSCYLSNPEDQSFIHKLGGAYEYPYPAVFSPPETAFSVSSVRATIKPSSDNTRDNLANLRVDSFSSYLKAEEENNFAFKTTGPPVQDSTIAFVFPQQASLGTPKHQERTKSKDGELNIFGADKYFSMKLDYGAVPTTGVKYGGQMNKGMVDLPHLKPSFQTGTPSICSKASSFNSQSALLQNLQRSRSQTKQKKMTGRRFFASFGCQGPCLDKKAVYVDETIGHGKVSKLALTSVPSMREKLSVVKKHVDDQDPSIEEQRKSLEVFGSDKMRKGDISVNLERKLSMLTWDAIPKVEDLPTTTIGSSTVGDDMASDASSDLFEIENISSSGYGHMNSQTTGDNYVPAGCMSTITTQHAPSEASIEWSVITASAADYSSVISDYDEKRISIAGNTTSRINAANKNSNTKYTVGKEGQKTHPGGLLGCKSNKAVSVVETVYKTGEKAKHHQRG
ncbi:protein PHYTOCHROME KINASE SUBSTRATE 3-like [Nicotiana tabacum]|uniref:Protein PHYTOCHROME KINASE SUBSTRATE 3-like n=2 Tax=Nicotiana TaxID=4085 RepID=A0AC58RW74_TOBAC|nr:PREDICTED: protein PHYTOCHROME KINASE SUBSTRATE 3-like [Nicotiana sylvestris]